MPFSHTEGKDKIVEWVRQINPSSIVDIGPGSGTYKHLLKDVTNFPIWIGIEPWGPYIRQYDLFNIYDHVIIGDMRHIYWDSVLTPGPDLVIAGDVIEHVSREEATSVLRELQLWAKNIIISIPLGTWDQGEYDSNWMEIHRDTWERGEMKYLLESAFGKVDSEEGELIGVYWWRSYD